MKIEELNLDEALQDFTGKSFRDGDVGATAVLERSAMLQGEGPYPDYLYAIECAFRIDLGKDSTLSPLMREQLEEIYGQFKTLYANALAETADTHRTIRGAKAFAEYTRLPKTEYGINTLIRHVAPDEQKTITYVDEKELSDLVQNSFASNFSRYCEENINNKIGRLKNHIRAVAGKFSIPDALAMLSLLERYMPTNRAESLVNCMVALGMDAEKNPESADMQQAMDFLGRFNMLDVFFADTHNEGTVAAFERLLPNISGHKILLALFTRNNNLVHSLAEENMFERASGVNMVSILACSRDGRAVLKVIFETEPTLAMRVKPELDFAPLNTDETGQRVIEILRDYNPLINQHFRALESAHPAARAA